MNLELISFKLCPFVQRSVITLLHKKEPYQITYIDLADPPPWFLDISPFGKVPVLKVDNDNILFESTVINEFLDDISGGELQPDDPLTKAVNRSWTEFGSSCLVDMFNLGLAKDQAVFEDKRDDIREKLERVEEVVGDGPFFNGDGFSLIDTAYAPLFIRLSWLGDIVEVVDWAQIPKMSAWKANLLAHPAVQASILPEVPAMYRRMLKSRGGIVGQMIAD